MSHSLTIASAIDLHPVTGTEGALHVLLVGATGPRITATWDGLEKLRDTLTDYLEQAEDDDPRPPEYEQDTLGYGGWDHPSRGT